MRGVKINNLLHTGNDLNMAMTKKDLPPPKAQTFTVEIPGRNGTLDISEALTGEPTFFNRELTFNFVGDGSRGNVLSLIETMLKYHNTYITLVVDDYKDWYYEGRATIDYTDHYNYVEFELKVDAQPFRYALTEKSYSYSGTSNKVVTITNNGVNVIPVITTDAEATITYREGTYNLSNGMYEDEKFKLLNGDNTFTLTSTGKITISYREAMI